MQRINVNQIFENDPSKEKKQKGNLSGNNK